MRFPFINLLPTFILLLNDQFSRNYCILIWRIIYIFQTCLEKVAQSCMDFRKSSSLQLWLTSLVVQFFLAPGLLDLRTFCEAYSKVSWLLPPVLTLELLLMTFDEEGMPQVLQEFSLNLQNGFNETKQLGSGKFLFFLLKVSVYIFSYKLWELIIF